MPFRTLYVSGDIGCVCTFESREDMMGWHFEINDIKQVIADIAQSINGTRDGNLDDYREWIEMVLLFANKWGKDRVPLDIRRSLNEVQEGCGVTVTAFP